MSNKTHSPLGEILPFWFVMLSPLIGIVLGVAAWFAQAHPPMILRAILAFFPLAICILVVVLAYQKTQGR